MRPSSALCLVLLTGACLAACSPAMPDGASAPAVQTAAASPAHGAVAASCTAVGDGSATSKTRHIPNEDDPCADSRGIARH